MTIGVGTVALFPSFIVQRNRTLAQTTGERKNHACSHGFCLPFGEGLITVKSVILITKNTEHTKCRYAGRTLSLEGRRGSVCHRCPHFTCIYDDSLDRHAPIFRLPILNCHFLQKSFLLS